MISNRNRYVWPLVLTVLAIGFQLVAIKEQSLSGDGAYHLMAGHQALRYGQNSMNLEHPPFAKLIFAIPTCILQSPLLPPRTADHAIAQIPIMYENFAHLQYATLGARSMALICFVIPFFGCCYALGRYFGNHQTGILLFGMVAFSLSVLPYLTILQTDVAISLGFLLTIFAVCKLRSRCNVPSAVVLGAAFGFSLSVKYSAVLLAPTVLYAFVSAKGRVSFKRLAGLAAVSAAISFSVLSLGYSLANWNYDSNQGRETIRKYCKGRSTLIVKDRLLAKENGLLAVERYHAGLAQWLTGLFGIDAQNKIGVYNSYAFGTVSRKGRWWYFPALLLAKTPLVILLYYGLSLWQERSRFRAWRRHSVAISHYFPVMLTVAVYMTMSITSNYNLGVRHMMPMIPLLYLPVAKVISSERTKSFILLSVLIAETVVLSPLWMTMTNTWWLGEKNPTRFAFSGGNLEYGQNYRQLAKYVEKHNIRALNVVYPRLDPRIIRAYIPDAKVMELSDPVSPGWYVVNTKVEQLIPGLGKISHGTADRSPRGSMETGMEANYRW